MYTNSVPEKSSTFTKMTWPSKPGSSWFPSQKHWLFCVIKRSFSPCWARASVFLNIMCKLNEDWLTKLVNETKISGDTQHYFPFGRLDGKLLIYSRSFWNYLFPFPTPIIIQSPFYLFWEFREGFPINETKLFYFTPALRSRVTFHALTALVTQLFCC